MILLRLLQRNRMDPHPKLGLSVKTDDNTTCIPRGYEMFITGIMKLLESGGGSHTGPKCVGEQGKEPD